MSIAISDFIPKYPSILDQRFYQDIYRKEEFYENRLGQPEKIDPDEDIDPSAYRPMKHQIIGTRYMSPYTRYDRLLVNHEMGTGKCVLPGTFIAVSNGSQRVHVKIEDLWNQKVDHSSVKLYETEEWALTKEPVYVKAFDNSGGNHDIKDSTVKHLYRQFIKEDIVQLETASTTISMTKAHKVYTLDGWKPSAQCKLSESIATYVKGAFVYEPIISLKLIKYHGYVYDLEVEQYHTYVANHIVTHNTCYAIGIIENLKNNDPSIKKAFVVSNSPRLYINFRNELLYKCGGTNKSEDEIDMEKEEGEEEVLEGRTPRNKFYVFDTFTKLAKRLESMSDEKIIERYSNSIIVLDEVHHIHESKKKKKTRGTVTYRQIHRMMHLVNNTRQILLTGTPMRNFCWEIVYILNLILPQKEQLSKDMFLKIPREQFGWTLNPAQLPRLKQSLKGRVTYLRADVSEVEVKEMPFNEELNRGLDIRWTTHNNLMSEFQTQIYKQAYLLDSKAVKTEEKTEDFDEILDENTSEKQGVFANSSQASLYVSDGDFEKMWPSDHLVKREKQLLAEELSKSNMPPRVPASGTIEAINQAYSNLINYVKQHSATYAAVLEQLIEHKDELAFVYCNLVAGSGLKTFIHMLEHFGYSELRVNYNSTADSIIRNLKPGLRYISTTEKRSRTKAGIGKAAKAAGLGKQTTDKTPKQLAKLIEVFNHPANRTGKYIQVIAGSEMIGEGYSFKNIRQIHVTTPFWNWAETSQAIARGLRAHSHDALIEDGSIPKIGRNNKLQVKLFLHAAIPVMHPLTKPPRRLPNVVCLDTYKYEVCTQKYRGIQEIQELVKTSSFDCQLTYARNIREGDEDYKCEGISKINLTPADIDYSTYQMYYFNTSKLKDAIQVMFKERDSIPLSEIWSVLRGTYAFKNINKFELLSGLYDLVLTNTVFQNRYTLDCFIKEYNNIFFLSPISEMFDMNINNLASYYSQNPTVLKDRNQATIFEQSYIDNIRRVILEDKVNRIANENLSKVLKPQMIERMIERSIEAVEENKITGGINPRKLNRANIVIDRYKNYITHTGSGKAEMYISAFLKEHKGPNRCFIVDTKTWVDCTSEMMKKTQVVNIDEIPHKIFGSIDTGAKVKKMKINYRKSDAGPREKEGGGVDKRTKIRGRTCKGSYPVDDLILILIELSVLPPGMDDVKELENTENAERIYANLENTLVDKLDFDELTPIQIALAELWGSREYSRNVMCETLEDYLKNEGKIYTV